MEKNILFLIFFIVILMGLFVIMPESFKKSLESLQDFWQGSIEFLNEIWESIKYFWDSNIQPFIQPFIDKLKIKTESVIKEKMKKDKPKIEQEFKREVQEMKAETSKAGRYFLERINNFIRR